MEQKYPTREQAESIASNDCAHEICRTCDIEKWCAGDRVETIGAISASRRCGMSMLAMHDEIDRLKALVPKTMRPEIASSKPCGSPVICECGWIVGIMDEWGESILDTDDTARANYCGQCGARMDYSEFEAQQGLEG